MEEDHDLIKRYLNGNQDSLRILIDKYTSPIYNYTARFVGSFQAPDVTQDIFVKVWKNLENFDLNKSQFKTWLFTIARNTITDYLRKKKIPSFSSLGDGELMEENIQDSAILPDEVYQKLQDKDMLSKLIDKLSDDHKTVLTLYYQEDMTFKEIGEVLGKPLDTVKSHHYRAIKKLKELCTKI